MLDIVTYGNEILAQKAEPVKEFTPELAAFVEELYDTMVKGHGVGLAANQVGKLLRIFVTGVDGDKQRVFINPEIIATSPEEADYEEGCLSLPEITGEVLRPPRAVITATNLKGERFTMAGAGLLARCWQHEHDHLEGVLILSRMNQMSRLRNRAAVRDLERRA